MSLPGFGQTNWRFLQPIRTPVSTNQSLPSMTSPVPSLEMMKGTFNCLLPSIVSVSSTKWVNKGAFLPSKPLGWIGLVSLRRFRPIVRFNRMKVSVFNMVYTSAPQSAWAFNLTEFES